MVTTRKSKALKLKRKLKRELSGKRKYITTYKDIKTYFKLVNSALFDGKLSPFGQVEIKDLKRMFKAVKINNQIKGLISRVTNQKI